MKTKVLIVIIATVALGSCKKEESAMEALTSRTWQMKEKYENGVDALNPCEADNAHRFKSGGVYELQTGAVPCFQGEDASYAGEWEINGEMSRMNLVYSNRNLTMDVITLTPSMLEVQYHQGNITVLEVYR